MKRKLLSLALALALCLGLTVPALADGTGAANNPTTVSAGSDHTGLIDANGSLWMWGENYFGQLGNDGGGNGQNAIGKYQTVPVKVLDNVVSVSCGYTHTAAIKSDGSLWMWGENYYGQLGNGSTKDSLVPVKVLDNVTAVSCGRYYTAAIKTDGSLWMWGRNDYGQLGKGAPGNSTIPVKVMDNVASVSCGSWGHTAAIKTDGSLWMWGDNGHGQLGNGGIGNKEYNAGFGPAPLQDIPVKVMDNVAAVSCGYLHTAAIKTDGSLWTWGGNEFGQLGNDRKYNADNWLVASKYQTVPVKVMDGVASVTCGNEYTAAVKTDGSLWMWGDNDQGQLGNGYVGNREINIGQGDFPVQTVPIELMDGVASVSCGAFQTFIVKTDGSVWACGRNGQGELGNGGTSNGVDIHNIAMQTTPVKLSGEFFDMNSTSSTTTPVSTTLKATTIQGTTSLDNSIAIANQYVKESGKLNNLVISTSSNWPDALSGSALAGAVNSPMLMVPLHVADATTQLNFIANNVNKGGTIYILGGSAVVSSDYESVLSSSGFTVKRLWGQDAVDTSVAVSNELASLKPINGAIIVPRCNYVDAVSISSYANQEGLPILITDKEDTKDSVVTFLKNYSATIKNVYVIGGNAVIGDSRIPVLSSAVSGNIIKRIWGMDRYDTGYSVATTLPQDNSKLDIVEGDDFVTALSAGPFAGHNKTFLMIVPSDTIAQGNINTLNARKYIKQNITLIGNVHTQNQLAQYVQQ